MDSGTDADGAARRGMMRWPVACWLTILVLIGIVQVMRAEWFDAGVFLVAVVLVLFSIRMPRSSAHRIRSGPVVVCATGLAAVTALLPRHSIAMMVAVLVIGAAALVAAWPDAATRPREWTRGSRRLGVAWAVIIVIGCLWELSQFIVGRLAPDQPSFALSDLVDPLLGTMLGKAVFAGAWLACGVFLVLRGAGRGVHDDRQHRVLPALRRSAGAGVVAHPRERSRGDRDRAVRSSAR
ncbi:hypothetical protein GCM10025863_25170 [Microbacterium suwonense]|uniref:Uncharacterized protein n=2 Tax=Microbacterium suwonense TaxID=683047 RepID=A0ABM8FW05_9MICO|nr:hypothetical protein GCM10025863_25170 [Microbacterium suwonense]